MAIKLAGGTTPYTLKEDRKSEKPTVFNVRDLNTSERAQLDDAFSAIPILSPEEKAPTTELAAIMRAMDTAYRKCCEIGVATVSNVLGHDGNVVADMPGMDVVAQLRNPAHIRELGKAVLDINKLDEEQRGNS